MHTLRPLVFVSAASRHNLESQLLGVPTDAVVETQHEHTWQIGACVQGAREVDRVERANRLDREGLPAALDSA